MTTAIQMIGTVLLIASLSACTQTKPKPCDFSKGYSVDHDCGPAISVNGF